MDYRKLRTYRSVILFVAGLFGAAYEVVINQVERPSVLILLAGMMGLPAFLDQRSDSDRKDAKAEGGP